MIPTPAQAEIVPLLTVATQAYRMAGVARRPGITLNGSEQQEALHVFNTIIDGLKIERFAFYQILRNAYPTRIGVKDYSVGDQGYNADWVIERPEKILSAGVLLPGDPAGTESEIPVHVCHSYLEYESIVCKLAPAQIPQVLYYQASLPTGTATLWPVPNAICQVVLYTPQTVQEFTDINADFIMPKGWREFMEYEGAVCIHDRYPTLPLSPMVPMRAAICKRRVLANQWTPAYMRSDPAVLGHTTPMPSWVFNGRTLIS